MRDRAEGSIDSFVVIVGALAAVSEALAFGVVIAAMVGALIVGIVRRL